MATIVLSAVGAAIGGSLGGTAFGLSSAVIGRAVGATIGQVIDQSVLGAGSQAVETGRVDRFRLTGASEGVPVARVYGRTRVSGQVIWASRFTERRSTSRGGGKGGRSGPTITSFSYSVSLAIGLCEGVISRVGRVWADGIEIARDDLNLRVYPGSEDQLPDPKIEAVQGAGMAPAYRGLAYVVIEDLELAAFGNRVPQFSFEVMRPDQGDDPAVAPDVTRAVRAVALMPGTGEYALAMTPVHVNEGPGRNRVVNVNTPTAKTDFSTSIDALFEELPDCGATSLVISWFGNDLRCGACSIRPKVEQTERDGVGMPWSVSGVTREEAETVAKVGGRPVYGGTPADASVIEAISALRDRAGAVMFYPFILMEQLAGNGLPDPWSDAGDQPVLPWRGRITTAIAAGRAGSSDKTGGAAEEVAAFFGQAQPGDFVATADGVRYQGPPDFSYRRFILHYAHLCLKGGGVEAFCIGSEMRGLTQIRDEAGSYPAVAELKSLARDVRAVLGPDVKIGYAADWSEYFGHHPQDGSGDVCFNLDPLWADSDIDFIGIDNYMPVSDWRDGVDHADAHWGAIHDIGYLRANIAGGEGYDWYYHAPEARALQRRSEIVDGAYGEDWVFRYKDLKGWWGNTHHDRPGGVRNGEPTAWVPASKPIWFTEIGCAAIDKGSNQPNRFLDPKSSESGLPRYSNGRRDDLIQAQFLRAVDAHWADSVNNPVSPLYGGPMVDMGRSFVWAWDARPHPFFPANRDLWSDGENYARGHWLNGRVGSRTLDSVVREICHEAGVAAIDTTTLFGLVRGYSVDGGSDARAVLQPLMLAHGFDAVERDGLLVWRTRTGQVDGGVLADRLVESAELPGITEEIRFPEAEMAGRVRLSFVEGDADYAIRAAEAQFSDDPAASVSQSEMSLVLTEGEGREVVERWLAEARMARDRVRFALPPSLARYGAGDVLRLGERSALWRLDAVEQGEFQQIEAVRVSPSSYLAGPEVETVPTMRPVRPVAPVLAEFLDLPLLTGEEVPHAPHLAVTAEPWTGPVAAFSGSGPDGLELNTVVDQPAVMGVTETELTAAAPASWDRGPPLRVRITGGGLSSSEAVSILNGANVAAIGLPGSDDWEVFQFVRADLVGLDSYALSLRLRGQAGTDALMPAIWPAGSRFVLLDATVGQIEMASSLRNLSRVYRIGPASRPLNDPVYSQDERAFAGVGLRPYAPVHVRADRQADGAIGLHWVRRTRFDGDLWSGVEVPLGEADERYLVRLDIGGSVFREAESRTPAWNYAADMQSADAVTGRVGVSVAQISDRFGPGLFRRIEIDV